MRRGLWWLLLWGWYDHVRWCSCLSSELLHFQLFSSCLDLSALWELNRRPILENHKSQLHKYHCVFFKTRSHTWDFSLIKQHSLCFYKVYLILLPQKMVSHGFFGSLLGRETWIGNLISCPVYTVCFKVGHLDVVIFDLPLYGFATSKNFFFLNHFWLQSLLTIQSAHAWWIFVNGFYSMAVHLWWLQSRFYSKKFGSCVKVVSGLNILYIYVIGVKLPKCSAIYYYH